MDLHKVRIEGGHFAGNTHIYLDGKPLNGVTRIEFVADVKERNQLVIHLIPEEVEIDAEAEVRQEKGS